MLFPLYDINPTQRRPYVMVALIAINLLTFTFTSSMGPVERQQLAVEHGFVPLRLKQLVNPQLQLEVQIEPDRVVMFRGGPQRVAGRRVELPPIRTQVLLSLISSLFLHGGLAHLGGNMWFLWVFGNNVEDRLGHGLFLLVYLAGGVIASLCHAAVTLGDPQAGIVPVIGASGAVAVVLGGYAIAYPFASVRCLLFIVVFFTVIEVPALAVLGIWFAAQLAEGVGRLRLNISGGVAWWAHIGGFLFGIVVMLLGAGWNRSGWERHARSGSSPAPATPRDTAGHQGHDVFWP